MTDNTHINVTINFSNWDAPEYDLRIPVHQPIKQLLLNLVETLKIDRTKVTHFAIKIRTKDLLLTDDDRLIDYQVADGDILIVL